MATIKNLANTTFNDLGLLVLRLFLGLSMFFAHGIGKWGRLFSGEEIHFRDPLGVGESTSLALAVFAEVICSLLLAFGLLTRWALVPLITTMVVAAFIVHASDGFGGMEKALLFGASYIALFLTGPGKYSIDSLLRNRKAVVNQ
ncbi:DoxX family protein [Arenibacter latericius]|uniref:DoxX family protein n=1 Tax=Arenibacter latericius TaxID=86104 RepID=UPI00040D6DB6|nr:DoxX family protein [Arenibacter latericius]MDX1364753.1 DoxX family protein [Arenibacter latericius]